MVFERGNVLRILEETNDWVLMEKIHLALLIADDFSSVAKLQDLYFKLPDSDKKGWICNTLEALMTSDSHIVTDSPKTGDAIYRTTFANRFKAANDYIDGLIKNNPGKIKTILDCCASDYRTTLEIARIAHANDESIKITGVDINTVLYLVSYKEGVRAVFDSRANLIRLYKNNIPWVKNIEGWISNNRLIDGPDDDVIKYYKEIMFVLRGHLNEEIKVSRTGLVPVEYSDEQGNSIKMVSLIHPEAIAWAVDHNLKFCQGDIFELAKTISKESVDVAIIGNTLGDCWGYYDHESTIEAIKAIGLTLVEGGRLIIGNNPSNISVVDFQFHVYERQGTNLRLIETIGEPRVWVGGLIVKEISCLSDFSSRQMTYRGVLTSGAVALVFSAVLGAAGAAFNLPNLSAVSMLILEVAGMFFAIFGIVKIWEIALKKIYQIRAGPEGVIAEFIESTGKIKFYVLDATLEKIRSSSSYLKKIPLLVVRFLLNNVLYPFVLIHEVLHKHLALLRNNEKFTYFAQGIIIFALAVFTYITCLPLAGVDMLDIAELVILLLYGNKLNGESNANKNWIKKIRLSLPNIKARVIKIKKIAIKVRKVIIKIRIFLRKEVRKINIKTREVRIKARGKIKQVFFKFMASFFRGAGVANYPIKPNKSMETGKILSGTGMDSGSKVQKIVQQIEKNKVSGFEVSGDI